MLVARLGAAGRAGLLVGALACTPLLAQQPPVAIETPEISAEPTAPASGVIETERGEPAQISAPVLTVDQDALFLRSAWGLRTQQLLEEQGQEIAAENERIARQLSEEEAELTRQRKTLDPADFRKKAEAFDLRATRIRRERAQLVQELNARGEASRGAFFQAALPIMGQVMRDRGAVAVLDRRTVFVSLDAIDITDALIDRIDRALGSGPDSLPELSEAPTTAASP